jgi:hypothetical protein
VKDNTLAQAAAAAAKDTRTIAKINAHAAYMHDSAQAHYRMTDDASFVTYKDVAECRPFLTACLAHLDEIERHLPSQGG